jgi:hypothetical protein
MQGVHHGAEAFLAHELGVLLAVLRPQNAHVFLLFAHQTAAVPRRGEFSPNSSGELARFIRGDASIAERPGPERVEMRLSVHAAQFQGFLGFDYGRRGCGVLRPRPSRKDFTTCGFSAVRGLQRWETGRII